MTLRPVFLVLAALSFLGALLAWKSEPPRPDTVFKARERMQLQGHAEAYTAPKGSPRVRLRTADGATYFTDCLAIMAVCAAPRGSRLPVVLQAVRTSSRTFWPITASTDGKLIVSPESSARAYELFVEREGSLYRLPLLLGVAFLVFAAWFGHRPALP